MRRESRSLASGGVCSNDCTPSVCTACTAGAAARRPPALRAQFDSAEQAVRAVGVTVWSMKEFEADDALATGAARFRDQVEQVRILTPDKDLGQCLIGDRVVQIDVIRKRLLDEAALL